MAETPLDRHIEQPGPTDFHDSRTRLEFKRAAVWLGLALIIVGVITLAHPLILIVGGMVFAVILDGGVRLLGRVLPVRRGVRLMLVILVGLGFLGWVAYYAGTTLAAQAAILRTVVEAQLARLLELANQSGIIAPSSRANIGSQIFGSVGKLTSVVGSAIGGIGSFLMIIVIGIFIASEPRLYDRGVAWMLPIGSRDKFYAITERVTFNLRRLMFGRIVGMLFEGIFTWVMLSLGNVPMAALLGLLTGLLAFLPNIGAIVSGVLMVAAGFSAGSEQGIWAIITYFVVQNVDGYLVVPYIARKTVDLAPALVLAAQLLLGTLFGILGLMLADPIIASIKVALEQLSKYRAAQAQADAVIDAKS